MVQLKLFQCGFCKGFVSTNVLLPIFLFLSLWPKTWPTFFCTLLRLEFYSIGMLYIYFASNAKAVNHLLVGAVLWALDLFVILLKTNHTHHNSAQPFNKATFLPHLTHKDISLAAMEFSDLLYLSQERIGSLTCIFLL